MQLSGRPLYNEFEYSFMVTELAKCTLPEAMQDMPPMKLLINALDPAAEFNAYDDDAESLKHILEANDSALVKVIRQINEADVSMATEVKQLLTRINEFLAGKIFAKKESKKEVEESEEFKDVNEKKQVKEVGGKISRPRGAAPKGKKWDYDEGMWITDDDGDSKISPVTTKTSRSPSGRDPVARLPSPTRGRSRSGITSSVGGLYATSCPSARPRSPQRPS